MLKQLIQTLRKQHIRVYNGVAVRNRDWYEPDDYYPADKQLLVETARGNVAPSDRVVLVGGGKGTVPTHVSRIGAETVVYEPAAQMVNTLRETKRLNNADFTIRHAAVGDVKHAYGSTAQAETVAPETLAGDVLILDCEGAEMSILPQPDFETVIVETHPGQGAPTQAVREQLTGASIVVGADPVAGDVVVRYAQ